jgi:hypothetical protein
MCYLNPSLERSDRRVSALVILVYMSKQLAVHCVVVEEREGVDACPLQTWQLPFRGRISPASAPLDGAGRRVQLRYGKPLHHDGRHIFEWH